MKPSISIFILLLAFTACKNTNSESTTMTDEVTNTEVTTQEGNNEVIEDVQVASASNEASETNNSDSKGQKVIDKVAVKNSTKTNPTTVNTPIKVKEETTIKVSDDTKIVKPPLIESAPTVDVEKEPIKQAAASIHDDFDSFLKSYVSNNGKVNYNKINANKSDLDKVIKTLQDNPVQDSWSKNKKLAYWINAYNAFTIKKIVDNYPVKSIKDLNEGKPWDTKFIKIGGSTYSLNNIENDIIRPTFKDARIHFAVNCAAKSCPPLINKAFTEENVNSLLASQTKKFINNDGFNQITNKSISVSKIFDWYKEYFGDLISFINKYSDTKIDSGAKVAYTEYNWSLNN